MTRRLSTEEKARRKAEQDRKRAEARAARESAPAGDPAPTAPPTGGMKWNGSTRIRSAPGNRPL